ncbi:MAG: hypothetical protein Q7R81_05540 [Candidatus Peregrinibacteria bacterium]|nr:hypothetical protein [Candidatus Peregrinibacteria bacterium]
MPNDDDTPATKKDLRELEARLEARLVQQFLVIAENLVRDFKGIFKDRLEQHEDRINSLERHTGLARA